MLLLASPSAAEKLAVGTTYQGVCDASGAVAIDARRFLVADDESNSLRLFELDKPDAVATFDMSGFLRPDEAKPESDMEAGTWLDGKAYWITSHGRNKTAKERVSRHRLFATDVKVDGSDVTVTGSGQPYTQLLDDLLADSRLAKYRLAEAATRKPKAEGALNIEGLVGTPEKSLLVGFRNPIPDGKALLVPILNPSEVVAGTARSKLGPAIELDLAGLGIRDITYDAAQKQYWIIAGHYDSGGEFKLFRWSGKPSAAPQLDREIEFNKHKLNPEIVCLFPASKTQPTTLRIFSDDGTKRVGTKQCKNADPSARSFRSVTIEEEARD